MPAGYLASYSFILWKLLESYGCDPQTLFEKAGIDADTIHRPGARVSTEAIDSLWSQAAELIDDPCFGLKAFGFWHPSHFNALGYGWLTSSTLREALRRLHRYSHIVYEGADFTLEECAEGLEVILSYSAASQRLRPRTESSLSVLMGMCRVNYGEKLNPVAVAFRFDETPCARKYEEYFRAPVRFNAAKSSITLPLDCLDEHLAGDNPHLALLHDQVIIRYLARLDKNDTIHRVQAAIIERLPSGNVTQDVVAASVHMSVRSLQRKLRALGTGYRSVLEETRLELARSYVRDLDTELAEVGFLLGFSDHSAFTRAFKKWTGKTPSEARLAARSA